MLKCAITGANGVLGRKLRKKLPYKFYCFKGKIENYEKVNKWISSEKFDLLIHLAAIVPTTKVNKDIKKAKLVNVTGTKNLVKAVLKCNNPPRWFFYASTSHVYRVNLKNKKLSEISAIKPHSRYGKTKRQGEKIIEKNFKNKKIKFCIGRIFSFTDKKQKPPYVIPTLISKIKTNKKKSLILKNLNHYRDFISTNEISKAIKILYQNKSFGIFNIGNEDKINLKKIAILLAKKYNKNISFEKDNSPTYLISNTDKIKKLGWRKKKFTNSLKYFY